MEASAQNDDKFTLDYSRRKHSSHEKSSATEISRDDMVMKNYQGELEKGLKNIVGPAFLMCGTYGFFLGIFQSARNHGFKNRPMKLIMSSIINTVGKQSSRFANAGASVGLVYCLTKKTVNFLFEEDLQGTSEFTRQVVYGFVTGCLFKSTRGVLPALLSGCLVAGFCGGLTCLPAKYKLL